MKKYIFSLIGLSSPIFCFADSEEKMPKSSLESNDITYNNRIAVFSPYHQVYERTKPDAFYVGIEGWYCGRIKDLKEFLNVEARFGYNFALKNKTTLTPFLGLTNIYQKFKKLSLNKGHSTSKELDIAFLSGGLYVSHSFSRLFELGLKTKGMIGIHESSTVYGVDAAVPLTFRFGSKRHWDFRLEPFNITIFKPFDGKGYESLFGLRNTIGYRF